MVLAIEYIAQRIRTKHRDKGLDLPWNENKPIKEGEKAPSLKLARGHRDLLTVLKDSPDKPKDWHVSLMGQGGCHKNILEQPREGLLGEVYQGSGRRICSLVRAGPTNWNYLERGSFM